MTSNLKKKVQNVTKTIAFFICLSGFFGNTFMIFKQFIGRQTVTSQDVQKNDQLTLPSFTICGRTGFKEKVTKYQDLQLENYLNKTFELEDIIGVIEGMSVKELRKNKTSWEVTTTYSQYKGRCYTIRYIPMVINITLNAMEYNLAICLIHMVINFLVFLGFRLAND